MKKHLLILLISVLSMSASYSQDIPNETIIKDVSIIDGNGNEPVLNSIRISNGTIAQIGSFDELVATDSTTIIDGTDKYLIPGLIDSHVHIQVGGDENGQKQLLLKMLKTGVTSVQDLIGDARDLAFYSKQQKRGIIESPEIYFAAMFTTLDFMKKEKRMAMFPEGRQGELPFFQAVDEHTDFKEAVARAHGAGANVIKFYTGLSENSMENLTKEAHEMGMKVWAHAAQFPLTVQDMLHIDIDVLCHAGLMAFTHDNVPSEYHDWTKNYNKDEFYNISPEKLDVDTVLNIMVEKDVILDATVSAWKFSEKSFETAKRITRRAHELGVKTTTGTDFEGFPTLEELYLMVEVIGLSPKEALMSSSKNGAEAIGIEKTHGTIEVGKVANLVLLNKNPLENIRNVEKIDLILIGGKAVNSE